MRPDASQWVPADTSSLIEIRNQLALQVLTTNSEENTRAFNTSVQAVIASLAGTAIWFARDRFTTAFAAEPRYLPEIEWDLNLDEIISECSYVLSDEHSDADLTDGESFAAIVHSLKTVGLLEIVDGVLMFDSFATQSEFEGEVVRAIEGWEMEQGPALSRPSEGD
ncbi:hypothetical protein [Granulicella sp. S156]|uniref:hypothetical protein n=1 Tax=Granulicella sp. S156 TaxID=1747224 RepID=UPI00131CE11A|nr:hypothetical protein [Granulicella sp. S156]